MLQRTGKNGSRRPSRAVAKTNKSRSNRPSRTARNGRPKPPAAHHPGIDGPTTEVPASRRASDVVRLSGHLLRVSESGPIPPPETVARYKQVDPRFADAILEGYVEQTRYRREIEKEAFVAESSFRFRGQTIGAVIAGAAVVAATLVGIYGSPWAVAAIMSVGVGAPVVASFAGRRSEPSGSAS